MADQPQSFPPSPAFTAQANLGDPQVYDQAAANPEGWWADQSRALLRWSTPFSTVCEWNPPHAKWFTDGKLNAADNCLDRHLGGAKRNQAALVWEGEPGDSRVLTYHDLHRETCKFANVLLSLGINKGDRVTIYLPLVPEAVVAMLACARIGAVHNVVFAGFSADSLRERIADSQSRLLITADGGWRRGGIVRLKEAADKALEGETTIKRVIVLNRTGDPKTVAMHGERDLW